MKTLIVEIDELAFPRVHLDPEMLEALKHVALIARDLIANHRVRKDADSFDILPRLIRGMATLEVMRETKQPRLRINAECIVDAHTAVCLVARSKNLTLQEKAEVLIILGFLATVLPCWVLVRNLPAWQEVRQYGKETRRVQKIYKCLRKQQMNEDGFHPASMHNALVLHAGIKLMVHPAIRVLWKDLNHVTASHRHALARLMATEVGP